MSFQNQGARLASSDRNQPSREQLVLACECGSTLKVSSLDEVEVNAYELVFVIKHHNQQHELISCADAALVRKRWHERNKNGS